MTILIIIIIINVIALSIYRFGSYVRSTKSGIIFNDEMDDFSVEGRNNSYGYPPSPSNYLRPSRRPLSSTTPTIITRDGEVVMVTGAAGGSTIPTATIQVGEIFKIN